MRTLGDIRTATFQTGTAPAQPPRSPCRASTRRFSTSSHCDRATATRIIEILRRDKRPTAVLVPHIIPLAGVDRGGGRRRFCPAESRRGTHRRAVGCADQSPPGFRRQAAARARVCSLRVAASCRRVDARARRFPVRGPIPVRPIALGGAADQPAHPNRSRGGSRGHPARDGGQPVGLGEPASARRARIAGWRIAGGRFRA